MGSIMTAPISYMRRTREYYLALGYPHPYEWACFDDVPFTQPVKPAAQMKIALLTTAAPFQPDKGEQGPGAPYNAEAKFYTPYRMPITPPPDLRISHIAIDRDHTTAADSASFFPLTALQKAAELGYIHSVCPYFYGLPTNRSQQTTLEKDAEIILNWVRQDSPDAVIAIPNCPICHQSVSLVMRHLEKADIPTIVMGCAKDIVEHVGVPRFHFSDFPLGNSAGKPHQPADQFKTILDTIRLLDDACLPRTTFSSPQIWSTDHSWKEDYSNAAKLSDAEITKRRAAFDDAKQKAKEIRLKSPSV